MAIKFVDKNAVPKVKPPKIVRARKVLLVFAIIGLVVLFISMFAPIAPAIFVMPIVIFLLVVVMFPTLCTLGAVWISDGYRNFINGLGEFIVNAGNTSLKIGEVLQKIVPYMGSVSLALVASYGIIAFIVYKKAPEEKGNKKHMLAGFILFGLAAIFFTFDLILAFAN